MGRTIIINGKAAHEDDAYSALVRYARANPEDPALVAGCPHGAPYTQGDLMYLLGFGLGLEGVPVDADCAGLLERAGVTLKTVPHYVVTADPETGQWLGEPELVGRVELWRWLLQRDTQAAHFGSYEVAADDGVSTETRAIEVRWAQIAPA